MTRLSDAGVTNIQWEEDEDGIITAEGLQSYELDLNNELAIFRGNKCINVIKCEDVCHAYAIAMSHESVLRWNIKQGKDGRGYPVNERGWRVKK